MNTLVQTYNHKFHKHIAYLFDDQQTFRVEWKDKAMLLHIIYFNK